MAKRRQTPARQRDLNQLAKQVVDISTGEAPDEAPAPANGRAVKRGMARATKLSPRKRREIARKAARARWGKTH